MHDSRRKVDLCNVADNRLEVEHIKAITNGHGELIVKVIVHYLLDVIIIPKIKLLLYLSMYSAIA